MKIADLRVSEIYDLSDASLRIVAVGRFILTRHFGKACDKSRILLQPQLPQNFQMPEAVSIQFTCGKLDAGIAILISPENHISKMK